MFIQEPNSRLEKVHALIEIKKKDEFTFAKQVRRRFTLNHAESRVRREQYIWTLGSSVLVQLVTSGQSPIFLTLCIE